MSYNRLYELCNEQKWFTSGSISQYQKLFDLNENGASLEELALVIYICSSNATREEILKILGENQ